MGAFECAVSGSSAFSSPLVKLTTCTEDRSHVFKRGRSKNRPRGGVLPFPAETRTVGTFAQNAGPVLIS